MRRWQTAATVLILMFVATRAFGHGEVVNVGSSASGGGALKLEGFDFAERIVVTPSSSNATMTLYTTTFPSFQFIDADQPGTPLYRLPDGTRLTLEITCDGSVCIDAGASIRLDRIVDATGETASIGEVAAGEHVHPEWRLLLPNGVVGEYRVRSRSPRRPPATASRRSTRLSSPTSLLRPPHRPPAPPRAPLPRPRRVRRSPRRRPRCRRAPHPR